MTETIQLQYLRNAVFHPGLRTGGTLQFVVANHADWGMFATMTVDRFLRSLALGLVLAVATVGCGGFTASRSISPATFLLPGIMDNRPAPSPLEMTTNLPVVNTLAQAR